MIDPIVRTARAYRGPYPFGGSRPVLMEVDDVGTAIVKFKENPQGPRLLANELIGFGIAELLGIEHPRVGCVNVPPTVLPHGGRIVLPPDEERDGATLLSGVQFYSVLLQPCDRLTADALRGLRVSNVAEFAGILALDILLDHFDRKEGNVNLLLCHEESRLRLKLIDLGHIFGSGVWELGNLTDYEFPEPSQPLDYPPSFYPFLQTVPDLAVFEPWLNRIAALSERDLALVMNRIPDQWDVTHTERAALTRYVLDRAQRLPAFIHARMGKERWWS